MKSAVIVNPYSGGGRTAAMWRGVRNEVRSRLGSLEEFVTKGPMDATRFAKQIAHSDYELLIVAGGDGTINEAVNGLYDLNAEGNSGGHTVVQAVHGGFPKPINLELKFGILSAGRGCDFIKSVAVPEDARKAIDLFIEPKVQKIDIGLCLFKDEFGRDKQRFFVNIACAGVAGKVAKQVSHTPRFLPPSLAYFSAVVTNFVTYRPQRLRVLLDNKEFFEGLAMNVFVANGGYSGAGMCWAPNAQVDDGFFDVILAEPSPKLMTLLQQHKIYDGSFLEIPGVHHKLAKKVVIETQEDVLLEIDGEQPGLAPALYTILPKSLNLVVA